MEWLLLWPLLGLLGWGWANFSINREYGSKEADDPVKWVVLVVAPFAGPVMLAMHVQAARNEDRRFHWGLRFK